MLPIVHCHDRKAGRVREFGGSVSVSVFVSGGGGAGVMGVDMTYTSLECVKKI